MAEVAREERRSVRYRVKFERISRDNHVPDQEFQARNADELALLIHRFAAPRCVSRAVEVIVDLERMEGSILAGGWSNAGSFTLERLDG